MTSVHQNLRPKAHPGLSLRAWALLTRFSGLTALCFHNDLVPYTCYIPRHPPAVSHGFLELICPVFLNPSAPLSCTGVTQCSPVASRCPSHTHLRSPHSCPGAPLPWACVSLGAHSSTLTMRPFETLLLGECIFGSRTAIAS